MISKQGCHHRRLVLAENIEVQQCSRGRVHLTIGNMTLRLRPSDFIATATALKVAADRMEVDGAEAATVTRLLC